ncbi:tryptophan synthase beta subunit-like PLP-dependent enzyme [Chytriomyces sp. MP71]|nr:tryptophan synthase beta subunit-like PLP-dependent enzyme [Chytriomyces sp. MP71]
MEGQIFNMESRTLAGTTAALAACLAAYVAIGFRKPSPASGSSSPNSKSSPANAPTVSTLSQTPLIEVPSLSAATGCTILGKMEMLSIGGSSKDRLARAVIEDAEARGLIAPHQGHFIVEGTVGSTGISLATIANAKGYKALIIMPDDQAKEKYELLTQLGAKIEKVRPVSIADANHFVRIAERRAKEINASGELNEQGNLIKAFFVNQFETRVNAETHFNQTGPEIFNQICALGLETKLDAFVMGAGTGGTLAGVSLYLKSRIPSLRVILADPEGSGLYYKVKNNIMYAPTEAEGTRKRHQVDTIVEGIGINRITANFQTALNTPGLITDAIKVLDKEAVEMSRYILRNDGLFCGSSTAVHLVAAVREARRLGPGHTVLTFLCDSGARHLTKFWNEDYVNRAGLTPHSGLRIRAMTLSYSGYSPRGYLLCALL